MHPLGEDAPRQKAVPIFPQPISCAQLLKNTAGEIFQERLAFSILSWKIGSSKPEKLDLLKPCIIYRTLRLTVNNLQRKGFQQHIQQGKKSHPCSCGRVNFETAYTYIPAIYWVLKARQQFPLIFRDTEQFQLPPRCQGYLWERNLPLQQAKPKDSKPDTPNLCCLSAPNSPLELHWASAEFRSDFP